jgi:hypothetical protein
MSSDRLNAAEHAPEIDQSKRGLLKSAAGIAVATSVGALSARAASAAAPAAPSAWGDPATLVTSLGAGTLAARSVAETVEAYSKGFGYVEYFRGRVPREMAEFWGAPAMAGRDVSVMGPPGYNRGLIRIVELGSDFKEISFHETLGWAALEIHVRSPEEVVQQVKGHNFVHTGGPGTAKDNEGNAFYRAAQFKGPSGEPLYMTQHMQLDTLMSVGRNNVGALFIQTLNVPSYRETLDFYVNTLKMKMRIEVDVPRGNLVKELGTPANARYKMAAVRAPEFSAIQIDDYPKTVPTRPASPGCFAPGVNICTFKTRDIDAVKKALNGANIKYAEIESNNCPPFPYGRAVCFVGRGGERLEIVEVK